MNSGIAFIGACFPNDILNKLIEEKRIEDIPANVFGWKIVKAIRSSGIDIEVINEHKMPMGLKVKENEFTYDGVRVKTYKYINLKFLNKISKACSIYRNLRKTSSNMIIVYSMHTPYLLPACLHSLKSKSNIVLVVPDLPEHMSENVSGIKAALKRVDRQVLNVLRKRVNGYILLSKHMAEYLKLDENYLVVEGIADSVIEKEVNIKNDYGEYILYSGEISDRYGIGGFIDSFIESDLPYKLLLCGKGSYVEKIKEIENTTKQIKYLGLVNREELQALQKKAVLLVNPRRSSDIYTKYSFPSKTMEYLLSGTPVMMEKLMGIPDDYYDYILTVKTDGWKKALSDFSALSDSERKIIGEKGKKFVSERKSIEAQGNRIVNYLMMLIEKKERDALL